MMRAILIYLLMLSITLAGCSDLWEEYFGEQEQSVNKKVWSELVTMEEYSEFVRYMEHFGLDSVIRSANSKTLFIPPNSAFDEYLTGDTAGFRETMMYHIIPTYFMLRNVEEGQYRWLETLTTKFALIRNSDLGYTIDGTEIVRQGPLYQDGKYYEIGQVVRPRPNLYEFIKRNNPAIGRYIDSRDTVILDRELSIPIGFNEAGQTVYDSVTTTSNIFEMEYFATSEEFRNISATLVIPGLELYEHALDEMAQTLGGHYSSNEDIPDDWEQSVLIPGLLHKGIYGGFLEPDDLRKGKTANINGDSVIVDYDVDPSSLFTCSNGIAYDYTNFSVDDSLFLENILEGETLCEEIAENRFSWIEGMVEVSGNKGFEPVKQEVGFASNDSVLNVDFTRNYTGGYALTFKLKHVFPQQKYRLVWRTNYRTTGIYSVYVNGEKVLLGLTGKEQYDTYQLINGFYSVLGYKIYPDNKGMCDVDGWVDNITEYGNVTITMEYLGPGEYTDNGLYIDYIALLPESNDY